VNAGLRIERIETGPGSLASMIHSRETNATPEPGKALAAASASKPDRVYWQQALSHEMAAHE
jgi:hypothetical protein